MRKRFALLCCRVARWLAPEYFANRLQSLDEMRKRLNVLRLRLCNMSRRQLDGHEGQHILAEVRSLEAIYKSAAEYGRKDYELLKIEVQVEDAKEKTKRKLFNGIAAALAQSAEIEKFMYFREYGGVRVAGIQIYLKHDK